MLEDTKKEMLNHLINLDNLPISVEELNHTFENFRLEQRPSYKNSIVLVPRVNPLSVESHIKVQVVYRCSYCQANASENPCEYCGSPRN